MTLSLPETSPDFGPAWHDIEQLVAQIDELSRSDVAFRDFAKELVTHSVSVLQAVGGAVWFCDAEGRLTPVYESNLWSQPGGHMEPHRQLATAMTQDCSPRGAATKPEADDDDDPIFLNDLLLQFSAIRTDRGVVGAIELGRSGTESAAVRRGQLKLLSVLAELAAQFVTRVELQKLRKSRSMWQQFRHFTEEVHRSLDLSATAYRLANEGKRFLGWGRVSVFAIWGRRARLLAVSGLDTLDRRANAVRSLENLAAAVSRTKTVLRYDGESSEVAPEIQRQLEQYVDQSHARTLIALPLEVPAHGSDEISPASPPDVVGVLIAERYTADASSGTDERLDLMVGPSAIALRNALDHQTLPWLPFLRIGGAGHRRSHAGRLLKVALAAVLLLSLVVAAWLIRVEFMVSATGGLKPTERRDVFAPLDAEIAELLVRHGNLVRAGQELLLLKRPELELELQRVQGEYETARKRLWAVESARLQSGPEEDMPAAQWAAEREELKARLASHQNQLTLLQAEMQKLSVCSPIAGRILTWDVEKLLQNRPVQRGQVLLSVGNEDGPWVVELEVPDDRIGHVMAAQRDTDAALDVSFELATRRGVTHRGHIMETASRTEIGDEGKATVLVTVTFDADTIDPLQPGSTVSAKIHCGQRSLAFVWLHDVIEVVREWLLL